MHLGQLTTAGPRLRIPMMASAGGGSGVDQSAFEERPSMERRLVLRVLKKWRALADELPRPSVHSIDGHDFGDLWPFCFTLQLGRYRTDPLIRYCGDAFTQPPGKMVELTHVTQLPRLTLIANAISFMEEVLSREVPITRGGEYTTRSGTVVRYRSILLPLGEPDGEMNFLLGAANSKEFMD